MGRVLKWLNDQPVWIGLIITGVIAFIISFGITAIFRWIAVRYLL